MLELDPSTTPVPFDLRTLDERSDAEIDALPFGVIGLDEVGTVLRYNLYESRLARLDRNQVLGRSFFNEIAPCTQGAEFQGRFRRVVAASNPSAIERFEFLFDFTFGAQLVSIELFAAPSGKRFYLCINRKEVRAPRPEIERSQLAAVQRELAPGESQRGVRRDALERRFVDVPAPFFAALRATCDRIAPESWQLLASEWGVQWGRRVAVDLEGSALEAGTSSLRELPMRRFAALVVAYLADRGWGLASIDFATANEGVVVIDLERSALAEAVPRPASSRPSTPAPGAPHDLACHLVAGCFSGLFTYVAERRLVAREVSCASSGAPRCSMVLVAHERRALVDDALQAGVRGVDPIRDVLRATPRARRPT